MNTSRLPSFGVCAPSSYADAERLDAGIRKLEELGHKVIVHPQARGRLGETQSAGTIIDKLNAIYDLVYDPKVDVVMFAGGGNFALHLLDALDYNVFRQHPKPIIGFSDSTALLNPIHHYTGLVTYHGPMVQQFRAEAFNDTHYRQMIDVLSGAATTLPVNGAEIVHEGVVQGKLIGGTIEVLRSLLFTPDCPELDGAILFLEDIGTELNHFDRTLTHMRHAGVFDRVGGLIFGQFTAMKDTGRPFGFSVPEIIRTHTAKLDKPVILNAPFGHIGMFPTYPVGAHATFDARQGNVNLSLVK